MRKSYILSALGPYLANCTMIALPSNILPAAENKIEPELQKSIGRSQAPKTTKTLPSAHHQACRPLAAPRPGSCTSRKRSPENAQSCTHTGTHGQRPISKNQLLNPKSEPAQCEIRWCPPAVARDVDVDDLAVAVEEQEEIVGSHTLRKGSSER
jgi:hypothetical protein